MRVNFFSLDPDQAQLKKNPLQLRIQPWVGIKFDLINHHFKLEFVILVYISF